MDRRGGGGRMPAVDARVDLDELVERWTLLGGEQDLVAGKRGATRLRFALLLKFYSFRGRFPRGRSEFAGPMSCYISARPTSPACRPQIRRPGQPLRPARRTPVGLIGVTTLATTG